MQNMKSSLSILVLMILIGPHSSAQGVAQLLHTGDELYASLETEEALRWYHHAYDIAPRDSKTIIRLVRAYGDIGWLHLRKDSSSQSNYLQAAAFAETLLTLEPAKAEAHFWFAMAKGSLIPFVGTSEKIHIGKDVRFHAEKAIELDSTYSYAYIILAIFEREEAKLSWFERAIAQIVFGEELNGSLTRSEELLFKALKYDNRSSYAYFELSRTYDTMGRKEDSIASLKKVIEFPINSQREERQRQIAAKFLARLQSTQ
jgi:tetratricopeptide (TPR) repeat protein